MIRTVFSVSLNGRMSVVSTVPGARPGETATLAGPLFGLLQQLRTVSLFTERR